MTSGTPWNESGLGPELRDAAREAARRSGQSVEQWLASTIIGSAAEAGVRPARRPAEPLQSTASSSTISNRLDELSARLERLTRGAPAAAPAAAAVHTARPATPASGPATSLQLADAVARMNERLDHLIAARSAEPAPRPVARAAAQPAPQPQYSPLVTADTSPLGIERAIAEIAERQRALEDGALQTALAPAAMAAPELQPAAAPGPDLSGLEAQLRTITAQLETLRRPCGVEDAVAELRRDLTEISKTLQDAMPRRALEALQAEVRALGERIDRGRDRAFDQQALAGIEHGLGEVRSALTALRPAESLSGVDTDLKELSRKIDLLAETGPDPELLRYLELAIGELRTLAARVASADTVSSLVDDVRSLAASVDRVATTERGGGLDALAARIEALAESLDTRVPDRPALPSNIEQMLESLADRFERMQVSHNDRPALDHIEQQIVRLAERFEDSNQRLGNLGTIERAIGELMHQVTEARAEAVVAAERVARAVVAESGEGSGGREVETLKRDLTELKLDHSASDRRTHDTLEAVHDTLERVVDRLAMIESDVRAGVRPRPEPELPVASAPPVQPTAPVAASPMPAAPQMPQALAPQAPAPQGSKWRGQAPKPPQAGAPRRPIVPDLPADTPLEPGTMGGGRPRAASPAERIAASEAALTAVKPQAGAEPAGKANFIAAARRAAQAAASETGPADAAGAEGQTEDKPTGGLMGRLLANRRRTLMLGIAAFVLVVGSWQIASLFAPAPQADAPAAAVSGKPASAKPLPSLAEPQAPAVVPPTANRQSGMIPAGEMAPPAGVIAPTNSETMNPAPAMPAPPADVTGSIARPQTASLSQAAPTADTLPAGIGGAALRNAALAGDPTAEYEIGVRFTEGRGVPVNLEEAARWFERAANQGLVPAIYRLGSIYEKGQGVRKNLDGARRLYVAAAERGNAKAMHNIAVLHAEGADGKPDYRAAAQWFGKAAAHGVADSQYNLGILYARGIGVDQNLAESYKWFSLAAAQGDQDAGKKREDVAARLDKQALVAAKLAVQTWTADTPPADAMTVAAPAGGWDKADAQATKPKPTSTVRPKAKAS